LEASDKVSFDQFLEDYFSQQLDEEAIQTVEKRSISAN
jgi:hypothetical protein